MDENAGAIEPESADLIALTTGLVSTYAANNHPQGGELATLIAAAHAALTPGQIRKSITPDALISVVDGKPYKTLKRHLTGHGLTIEQYRERYGLPRDYPSTAASDSEQRSALARSLGLGRQRRKAAPNPAEPAADQPMRAGRPRKT